MTQREPPSLVIGLLGDNIGGSLAAASPGRRGRGPRPLPRLPPDGRHAYSASARTTPATCWRWAVRLGFDGLNVTHPFKNVVLDLVDERSARCEGARGGRTLVVIRDGRTVGHNTDWSRVRLGVVGDVAPGRGTGRRPARGRGCRRRRRLRRAPGRGAASSRGRHRRGACPRRRRAPHDSTGSRMCHRAHRRRHRAPGRRRPHPGHPGRHDGHPGMPLDPATIDPGQWVAEIIYFPLRDRARPRGAGRGCATMTGGAMAVFQHAAAFELFTGERADVTRISAHFTSSPASTSSVGPVRSSSPSCRRTPAEEHCAQENRHRLHQWDLVDKLEAIAAAHFDSVELFDADVVASPCRPEEIAQRCAGPRSGHRPLPAAARRRRSLT